MNAINRSFSRAWSLGLLALAACDDGGFPCTEGRQVSCDCEDSYSSGVQVCGKHGRYGECQCGDSVDYPGDQPIRRDASISSGSSSSGSGIDWNQFFGDAGVFFARPDAGSDAGTVVLGTCSSKSLSYRPSDVEYSASLDRIVAIAGAPDRLLIQDPHADTATEVALPLSASAVSVAPDGKTAAVAHNAYLSLVDLVAGQVTSTIPTSAGQGDVVLGGNGYAYVFPKSSSSVNIHSVELATKTDHVGKQYAFYSGALVRLHPGGSAIYGIETGSSIYSLKRVDIASGPAADMIANSPYASDHPACEQVWFTASGDRGFSACGNAFRATPGAMDDMTYAGTLGGSAGRFKWLVHSSVTARIYAIPTASNVYYYPDTPKAALEERQVRVYTADFLALETSLDVPCLQTTQGKQAVFGKYVFASPKGDELYVIGQLDPAVGAAQDWALAVIAL
jgi:hypothetical protein